MESTADCIRLLVLVATIFFSLTDGRVSSVQDLHFPGSKMGTSPIYRKMKFEFAKPESYGLSSPFPMPPIESQTPLPSPNYSPAPFSIYPPFLPQPPFQSPPHTVSRPPPPPSPISPSPPHLISPSPSPPKHVPLPPIYQPPVVTAPPPPHKKKPHYAVWCVAKPTVPDSIIQEALDYACGSGADCKSIQPKGPCFQPNTLFAHASYAFNSYWQKSKQAGGTCDFGGTAMLVTIDPSFDECQFVSN